MDYHDSFKLYAFVPWFLSWTLRVLVETEDCFDPLGTTVAALLRSRAARRVRKTHIGESKCGECVEEDVCSEEDSVVASVSSVSDGEDSEGSDCSDSDSRAMYSACCEGITDAPAPSTIGEVCNAINHTTLTCIPANNDTTTRNAKRNSSDMGGVANGVKVPLIKKQRAEDVTAMLPAGTVAVLFCVSCE